MKTKLPLLMMFGIPFLILFVACHKNQDYPKNFTLSESSSLLSPGDSVEVYGKYKNCSSKNSSETWEISTKQDNIYLSINKNEPNCKLIITNFNIIKNDTNKNYISENTNGVEVQENFQSDAAIFKHNDEILHVLFKIDSKKYSDKIILHAYFAERSKFILNKNNDNSTQNSASTPLDSSTSTPTEPSSLSPISPETAAQSILFDLNDYQCKNRSITEIKLQNDTNFNYYLVMDSYLNTEIKKLENKILSLSEAENEIKFFFTNVPIKNNSKKDETNTEANMLLYCKFRYYLHLVNQFLDTYKNRIIYLIPQKDSFTIGKIPRNKFGKKTSGGATENLQELSDFYIDHENLGLLKNTSNFKFINKNTNAVICQDLNLETDGNKVIATKFPNAVQTATPCTFEVHNTLNNNIETELTVLLNHTYRYWCQADPNLQAQQTAMAIGLCDKSDKEIKNVFELNLQKKEIKDLSPISGFYYLISLNLQENNITEIPPHIFDNLSLLLDLDINQNQIEKIPENIFYNSLALRILEIDLSKTNIVSNKLFSKQKILSSLSLSYNNDQKIPENIFNLNNFLAYIDIYVNNYNQISEYMFDNLSEINHIYLRDKETSDYKVPERILNRLTQFKKLQGTHQFFSKPKPKED
ncbi:hypothetical protein [Spirobacillus cienkowskii]|uniref:hypothetical protein n=1 Tax=Spirobacillus cienkowskii TaxID=495820 RepID=UPI0030D4A27C